jgi:WD40 repeat protein
MLTIGRDQTIHADTVQGDKVMGSKIAVDTISNSTGIAIGDGAQSIVNSIVNQITQQALSAIDEADKARNNALRILAENVRDYVQRMAQSISQKHIGQGQPYRGLIHYTLSDAEFFFGRDRAIAELLERVSNNRLTILQSESGAGKSSLLHAGITPRLLTAGHLPLILRPYDLSPSLKIKQVFLTGLEDNAEFKDIGLRNFLHAVTRILGQSVTIYLMLDQFEQFFTHLAATNHSTAAELRTTFINDLADCLEDPSLNVAWVLALRSEFFAELDSFRPRIRNPFANYYRLNRLTHTEAETVITAPAAQYQIHFESGLITDMLNDLKQPDEGIAPPQIQLICQTLYQIFKESQHNGANWSNTITLQMYEEEERAEGILRRYLNRSLIRTFHNGEDQELARSVLVELISADQHRLRLHRSILEQRLVSTSVSTAKLEATLQNLVYIHLLIAEKEDDDTEAAYELAHDYLLGAIQLDPAVLAQKTAQELLDQEVSAYGRVETLLSKAKFDIINSQRTHLVVNEQAALLLKLSEAQIQQEEQEKEEARQRELSQAQALAAEQSAHAQAEANSARTFRWAAIISIILLAFTLLGMYIAYDRQLAAEASEKIAQKERGNAEAQRLISRSGEVAAVANSRLIAGDSQLALLLGAAALNQITYTPQARAVTQAALEQWRQVATFPGHTDMVTGITFSRNNRYLATASWDDRARVWDLQTNQLLFVVDTHQADVSGAFFSIDNQYLITASRDNTIQTRTIPDGQLIYTLTLDFPVRSLAIHPGGDWFAVRSGNQVWLYDIVTGRVVEKSPYELEGVDVRVLTFTRDGKQILAGANDNLAHIWDIASGQHGSLQIDQGHQHAVTSVQQSSDRRFIASMSDDLLLLWEWANGFQARGLKQAGDGTLFRGQLEFSPDSRYLAAGSASGVIRLWDLSNLEADPYQLIGHTAEVKGIYYSPDGRLLASASRDGTVLLWNLTTRESFTLVTNQNDNGSAPVFSRDGRLIATGDSEGTVHLWKVNYGGNIGYYPLLTYPAETAALSADQLVMVGEDGLLEFWRPHNGAVRAHKLSAARLTALASRPTANLLAAGDAQGELFLFDSRADTLLHSWTTQQGRINALLMLPITNTLVTAGSDATLQIWDWQTQQLSNTLAYHNRDVSSLLALPDGSGFLSAGMDGAVVAWSLPKAESRLILQHEEPLISLAVSPSGQIIAAGTTLEHIVVKDITADKTFSILAGTIVHALTFVDDHTLAVGGENGEIQLWDLNARTASKYNAHGNHWIRALTVSEDGRILYSVGDDGLAKAWLLQNDDIFDLACLRAGRALTPAEWDDYFTFNISTNFCPPTSSPLTDTLMELPDPKSNDTDQKRSNLPFILFFDALNGTHVAKGETVTLRWHAENATGVYLESGDQSEGVPGIGSKAITIDQPTTFRLKVKNWFGERIMEITITPSL